MVMRKTIDHKVLEDKRNSANYIKAENCYIIRTTRFIKPRFMLHSFHHSYAHKKHKCSFLTLLLNDTKAGWNNAKTKKLRTFKNKLVGR